MVGPAVALFVGALFLLLGWQTETMLELAVGLGWSEDQAPSMRLGLLGVGYGVGAALTVGAVVAFIRAATDRAGLYAPYVEALTPVAAEYGRVVETHPKDGLGFASGAEGVRLEILVQPSSPGFISIWLQTPAQQRLLFLPAEAGSNPVDDADWRLVGRRANWVLRAEMPSVARPLLNEGALIDDVTGLMRHRETRAVRHDQRGVEVLMDLVPAKDLRLVLKDALRAARRLRRTNSL